MDKLATTEEDTLRNTQGLETREVLLQNTEVLSNQRLNEIQDGHSNVQTSLYIPQPNKMEVLPIESNTSASILPLIGQTVQKDPLINTHSDVLSSTPQQPSLLNHQSLTEQIPQSSQLQQPPIEPLKQLLQNFNIGPLLAIIDQVDLTLTINGKPLLSILCQKHLPLGKILGKRKIQFKNDDHNRSALHYAIENDDVQSAYWCMQNSIENVRDNAGNTPILDAIRLNRRRIFLLCLKFKFYDSEAPLVCAMHNQVWMLQILQSMRYDVANVIDSSGLSTLDRAVQHYSFESAQYLFRLNPTVSLNQLAKKTDSVALIHNFKTIKKNQSQLHNTILPICLILLNIVTVFIGCNYITQYQTQRLLFNTLLFVLQFSLISMTILSYCNSHNNKSSSNTKILTLLKAPQFPTLDNICGQCLAFELSGYYHCIRCNRCVHQFHFHTFVCCNKSNQIYWFAFQILWLYILWHLNTILIYQNQFDHLATFHFSWFSYFRICSIFETYWLTQRYHMILWKIYLLVFLLYQCLLCLQIIIMMGLNRTYSQVNNTQNYIELYDIANDQFGRYRNKQKRLMSNGLLSGIFKAAVNVIKYVFR